MKCPICGEQLRPGKKDPNYLLCYNCKKKYKAPQSSAPKKETKVSKSSASKQKAKTKKLKVQEDEEDDDEQRYSNLPPKKVRDKREDEMRRAYDEMLAVGDGRSKKKKSKDKVSTKKRQRDYDDDYDDYDDDYYDDDRVSKAPIIILGIAIIVVAAVIAYMILFKK